MSEESFKTVGNAQAIVSKVQTQTDGGFRVTLDLPETEINLIQEILRIKSDPRQTPIFYVAFVKKPEEY